ncbi:Hsp20/alpha crystallin family protein [Fervidibacter sp.]|jgi:HSP20 family protein|nr:Hsp20/alpha crystallin family protein [Armatimonadota bacterium]
MEEMRFWVQRVYLQVGSHWEPAVDVCEDDEAYYVIVDVAGVDKDDLEVEYHPNGLLVVRGVRRPPLVGSSVQYLVLEIPYGSFERRIPLPGSVNADGITAEHRSGFLQIRIPKKVPSERTKLLAIKP